MSTTTAGFFRGVGNGSGTVLVFPVSGRNRSSTFMVPLEMPPYIITWEWDGDEGLSVGVRG